MSLKIKTKSYKATGMKSGFGSDIMEKGMNAVLEGFAKEIKILKGCFLDLKPRKSDS